MGMIYKRGEIYWIKFYDNGKPIYESTHSDKHNVAKDRLKEQEGKVENKTFKGDKRASTMRFEELVDKLIEDYKDENRKSLRRAELSINHLSKHFSGKRVSSITEEQIERYIKKRREKGIANGTINRELSALKKMFSLVKKSGIVCPDIRRLNEKGNKRSGFFEPQEFFKLREALPDYLKPVLTLAYHTGMRKEEILSLTWPEVDLIEGRIILEAGTTKNNEPRIIPISGELLEIVSRQKEIRDKEYPQCSFVFFKEGKKIGDFRKTWTTALRECKYKPTFKCKKCRMIVELLEGMEKEALTCPKCGSNQLKKNDRIFHDLRRTALRRMIRIGISENIAMKISGHLRRDVFDRYDIVTENDVRAATERLMASHREVEKNFSQAVPTVTKQLQFEESEAWLNNVSQ